MSTPKSETAEAKSIDTPADRLDELAEQSTTLARLVTRNESAIPELLEQLSHHSDTTVRKWVCAHANTPPEVLGKLGGQFPQQLLENPALDFMILENPNLLRELPQAAKTSMLKRQTCPASLIELMAQDMDWEEGMQLAIAMNPNTPAHVIQKLHKSSYNKVKDAARLHIHAGRSKKDDVALGNAVKKDLARSFKIEQWIPWALVARLERTGTAGRDVLREMLLQKDMTDADLANPNTTIERVVELLPRASLGIRMSMARNPNATSAVLQLLAQDKSQSVREVVARHPNLSPETLQQLAQDKSENVRKNTAENPNLQPETLQQLTQDSSGLVRGTVAKKPSLQPQSLHQLAHDRSWWVRYCVAMNKSAPVEALQHLASDTSWDIRQRVAWNASTPLKALQQLAQDKNEFVRLAAAGNRNFPRHSSRSHIYALKVARSIHTPEEILKLLARYKDFEVRDAVADNPGKPTVIYEQEENAGFDMPHDVSSFLVRLRYAGNPFTKAGTLQQLAKDRNATTREAVAKNPNTPAETLLALLNDKHPDVASSAAHNPNCPPLLQSDEYMPFLASLPFLPVNSYGIYARHADPVVRAALASNPLAPTALLKKLADDSDVEVRLALAKNSWANPTIHALLSNDAVPKIRSAVARQPRLSHEQQLALAADDQPTVRASLARNKNCSAELLMQLASDEKFSVRKAVAANPQLTTALIQQLSEDDDARVRESVWRRTDLAKKVREQLDQEFGVRPVKKAKSKSVVMSVKSGKPLKAKKIVGPDTSILTTIGKFSQKSEYRKLSAHLIKLYQTLPYEQCGKLLDFMSAESKQALPGAFANHYAATFAKGVRPSFNRLLALMLDECPTPIIAKAVRSNDWLERLAVATHPKVPPNTLKILCNDGNKWVRQAAGRRSQQVLGV